MVKRTRLNDQLVCLWTDDPRHLALASYQELLAIDLLHAELRFRRCEALVVADGKSNAVNTKFPFPSPMSNS